MSEYEKMIGFADVKATIDGLLNDIDQEKFQLKSLTTAHHAFAIELKRRLDKKAVGVPVDESSVRKPNEGSNNNNLAWFGVLVALLFSNPTNGFGKGGDRLDALETRINLEALDRGKRLEAIEKQLAEYEAGRKEREEAEYQRRLKEMQRKIDELTHALMECECIRVTDDGRIISNAEL